MKSSSDVRPPVVQDLGDGSWYYNYQVKEVTVTKEGGEGKTAFEYETVHIREKPGYETLVNAVIAVHYSPSKETGLINKYIAFTLGAGDSIDKANYETYISRVSEIKAMVKKDLRDLGLMPAEAAG